MPGRSERGGEILGHQGDVRAARARRGQRIGRRGAASAAPLPVEELGRCARPGVLGWLPHRLPEPARLGPVQWDHGVESARCMERTGIADVADRRVAAYSLGMKQRLSLAAALLGDPCNLILDEPLNGLDPKGVRWLRGLLREQAGRGRVVLLSSHLLDEIETLADRVIVLDGGRVLAECGADGLREAGGLEDWFFAVTEEASDAKG